MTTLERFNEMLEQGTEAYFDADELVELIEHFDDADDREGYTQALALGLRLHPEDPEIRALECRLALYDERYDEALKMIERLRSNGEDDIELDAMELECLYATNRSTEADERLSRFPKNEQTEEIYEALAAMLADLKRNDEAKRVVIRGLELFPDNISLKEERCYHAERETHWQEALEQCEELIDIDPYSGDYWFMHGRLMAKLGNYDRAVRSLEFALTCNEDDIEAKLLRTYALYASNNFEKAIEAYVELITDEHFVNEQLRGFTEKYDLEYEDLEKASQEFRRLFGSIPDMLRTLTGNQADLQNLTLSFDRKHIEQIEYIVGKLILEARAIRKSGRDWDKTLLEDLRYLRFGDLHRGASNGMPPGERLSDEILRNKFYLN